MMLARSRFTQHAGVHRVGNRSAIRTTFGTVACALVIAPLLLAVSGCAPSASKTPATESSPAALPSSLVSPTPIPLPTYTGPRTGADLPNAPRTEVDWSKYGANLKTIAQTYSVTDPPPVPVVQWVDPEQEATYVNPCVEAQGYEIKNGDWVGITTAQTTQFNLAIYVCNASYPPIPRYTGQYTVKNLSNAYRYMVGTEIPCLAKHGYRITDVPTEAVWTSTYYTSPFYPYSQIPALNNDKEAALNSACPQWPPSAILWGN